MSVDHASAVAAPKSDPVFLHVRAGMTVIVEDGKDWRMADVIWVDGGARNPKVPTLFQVADVDTGVINWVNADLADLADRQFQAESVGWHKAKHYQQNPS